MSTVDKTLDLIRASERLSALTVPLGAVREGVAHVREIAPELGPELDAILERVTESYEHVIAAIGVLSAQLNVDGADE